MIYFIENYKSTEGSKNLIQMVIFVKKKKNEHYEHGV